MVNITEIEQKKEYLSSYKNQCNRIRSLQSQKKSMFETMISAKSQNYSDMPSAVRKTDLSDIMVKLENILEEIDRENAKCISIKVSIESAILNMKNGLESEVLHKKYILCKPWKKICSEMGYERTQIHRIHGRALQHIELGGMNEKSNRS